MNIPFLHRRRAERFAQLLDGFGDARRTEDPELSDLLAVSGRLRQMNVNPHADPEFRTDLRAMLMATIEREGIGATAIEPEPAPEPVRRPAVTASLAWVPIRSRRARGAVVVGLAVSALAVSGLSAIGGSAGPGDALYGMKRSAERAQLALSSSETGRGELYLGFARTRMSEVATGRGDIVAVLTEMDDETRQGVRLLTTTAVDRHDPASLDPIDTFVTEQRHAIAGVLTSLNGDVRTRTIGSLQLLDQVKQRVDGLRGSLGCGAAASSPADALGPIPDACASTDPSTASVYRPPTASSPANTGVTKSPQTKTTVSAPTPTSRGATVPQRPGYTPSPTPAASGLPANDGILGRIARLLGIG